MRIGKLLSELYLPAIFTAILSMVVLLSGCGEAASNNANANANKPVNASGNANNVNTAANTLNSTSTANTGPPPVVITQDTLKAALKARLMRDHLSILKIRDWDKDEWIDL
ncbi:MAG: hypothetical protein IPK98_07040 [Chloracidobacterium sp.]|nr:hypothetical protein [Chloracidobacterium sp.]